MNRIDVRRACFQFFFRESGDQSDAQLFQWFIYTCTGNTIVHCNECSRNALVVREVGTVQAPVDFNQSIMPQKDFARLRVISSPAASRSRQTTQRNGTKSQPTWNHDGGMQQQCNGHRAWQRGCRSVDTSGRGRWWSHFGPSRRN